MRGAKWALQGAAGFWIALAGSVVGTDAGATTVTRNSITASVTANPAAFAPSLYGAYRFDFSNNSSGTFNNARFRASLSTGATFVASATPVEPGRATCTFLPNATSPTEVDCIIGNGDIPANGTTTFNFQIATPASGAVTLDWNVRSGLGAPNYLVGQEVTPISTETVGDTAKLTTPVPALADGVFVFTGVDNTPRAGDKHTTASKIFPVSGTLIIASITEGTAANPNGVCVSLAAKFCSRISVETSDGQKAKYDPFNSAESTLTDKLRIILRADAQAVVGLNINTARIYYTPDSLDEGPRRELLNCPSRKDSYVPTADFSPCIHSRTVLGKKFGEALAGDWEVELFALKNGMIEIE